MSGQPADDGVPALAPSFRPFFVSTFALKDSGAELVIFIEKRGDPVRLLMPGVDIALGRGLAIAIGKAITAAGSATEFGRGSRSSIQREAPVPLPAGEEGAL